MKTYELTYLISLDLLEDGATNLQEKIVSFITQKNGSLVDKYPIAKRALAYSIEKQDHAFLATIIFKLPAEEIRNLEVLLKEETQILRYLILIKKPLKEIKRKAPVEKVLVEKKEKVEKEKKVELKEIEKKLEEILKVEEE